jgi:hypothetical protein
MIVSLPFLAQHEFTRCARTRLLTIWPLGLMVTQRDGTEWQFTIATEIADKMEGYAFRDVLFFHFA